MTEERQVINLEASPVVPAEAPKFNPHVAWDALMRSIQQAKALGKSPAILEDIPTGYTMKLGKDKYGNVLVPALRGKYVRYAFDRYGRLSTGAPGRGRLRPHWNKTKLMIKDLGIELFRQGFTAYSDEMRAEDAKDGKPFQGITPEEFAPIAANAVKDAPRLFKKLRRAERKARRARQHVARRINFGLIPGNVDRRNHASA
jgi:hypothetical protein